MRYARLLLLIFLGFAMHSVRAQQVTSEEKSFFEKNLGKLVQVEPAPLTGAALAKVFDATFYTVKVTTGGGGSATTLVAARAGDSLSNVTLPEGTADLATLQAVVKPGFKLKSDADGQAFEAALDLLYPPDSRYDEKRKAVRHAGTEWTFIRGVFIGNFKGLVVTTDADGTITHIRYSRDIKS